MTDLCRSSATPPKQQIGKVWVGSLWLQNEVKGAATDQGDLVGCLIFALEKHGDSHLPFLDGTSKMTDFPKFAPARVSVKMKFGEWDFTHNYFQLVFFLGKIHSRKTNSAVLQTANQKFTFFPSVSAC